MCDRQIMTNVACFWQPGLGKIMQSGAYSLHAPAKEVFTDDQSRATKQEQANLCAVTVLCAST